MTRRGVRRLAISVALAGAAAAALSGVAAAHGGALTGAGGGRLAVPTWLFLATGGGVVGASFLLASFVTDRGLVARLNARRRAVDLPWALGPLGRVLGVAALALLLVGGLFGPTGAATNAAVLLVWVGWWAGVVMIAYLLGNPWPAIDPFRTLARPLAAERLEYPEGLGRWPAAVGLLVLVWVEVVSPVADEPTVLVGLVVAYAVVAVAVAAAFGLETWTERVDPVSGLFALYGRVGVLGRSGSARGPPGESVAATGGDDGMAGADREPVADGGAGHALRPPGSGLVERLARDRGTVGLVVALVWGTSFDGLVQTPAWAAFARAVVGAGIPPAILYPAALFAGYGLFLGVYWAACRRARSMAPTFAATGTLARAFAPSLLAIAAGYHLAHYLGYLLALSPALASAVAAPLSGGSGVQLVLPGWFGGLSIAFVLAGHVLAIWVAHGVGYERFPSRLQALRSQYAVTAVMVAYTMVSLWIVTRPISQPPFV